jgi:hypothetical protein
VRRSIAALALFAASAAEAAPVSPRRGGSYESKLEKLTKSLVLAPYVRSPLGEGEGIDADPRFRLDAFDCTTFVETAMALGRSSAPDRAAELLDQIRYSGAPSFETRRHLIEAQWIPDLVRAGWVTDITHDLGGNRVEEMTIEIDRESWKSRRVAKGLDLREHVPYGRWRLPFIPIEDLAAGKVDLPAGTIINVVRAWVPWSPTMISHQGLVLDPPRGGARFVRHASPVAKKVIDEPLSRMMQRYLHPRKPKKWKVIGINVLRVTPPP